MQPGVSATSSNLLSFDLFYLFPHFFHSEVLKYFKNTVATVFNISGLYCEARLSVFLTPKLLFCHINKPVTQLLQGRLLSKLHCSLFRGHGFRVHGHSLTVLIGNPR